MVYGFLPPTGLTDSTLSYLSSPLFSSPSCDKVTTSTFWFQNQKARRTPCRLPTLPATCSSSQKSQGSGCPTLIMAPFLNTHCQQPGPSHHHLSLDARHSFLMVPSPELQLSFMKHPWRASVHNQESFVQLFGCHLPSASAFKFPVLPRSGLLHLACVISPHYCSQGRPHSGNKCHVLPHLNLNTSWPRACVSLKTLLTGSTPIQLPIPQHAPLPFRICLPPSFLYNLP